MAQINSRHRTSAILLTAFSALTLGRAADVSSGSVSLEVRTSVLTKAVEQGIREAGGMDGKISKDLPTITNEISGLDLTNAPEVLQVYGSALFGISISDPLKLGLQIRRPNVTLRIKLESAQFAPGSRSGSAKLKFRLAVDSFSLRVPELRIKEVNLTPPTPIQEGSCNAGLPVQNFYQDRAWVQLNGISLRPKNRNAASTFYITGSVNITPNGDGAQLQLASLTTNIEQASRDRYALRVEKVTVPPVRIKIDGECFDVPTDGVDRFIRSQLDTLKENTLKALSRLIVEQGLGKANLLLTRIKIPTAYEMNPPATRVVTGPGAIWSDFLAMRLKIAFSGIEVASPDRVRLGFGAPLRNAPDDSAADLSDLRLVAGADFISEQLNLIEQAKILERRVLPTGITLDNQGIELKTANARTMALVVGLNINLRRLDGIPARLGSYYERLVGRTGGILRLKLQVNCTPVIVPDSTGGKLALHLGMRQDYMGTSFGDRSNLDDASALVRRLLIRKLDEISQKVALTRMSLPLAGLQQKSGLILRTIRFGTDDNIAIGLDLIGRQP